MPTPWFSSQLSAFETAFQQQLSELKAPDARLKEAILYSTLNGGKRLRALLVVAAGELSGAKLSALHKIGTAIEAIHAYSLIHDDLPAMDNDDIRRGKPTCHKAFDEATAILAGDALLTYAFEVLAKIEELPIKIRLELIQLYATSAGANGMVGGQSLDLASENRTISLSQLESIHRHKTGALIKAAILSGAMAGSDNDAILTPLTQYADNVGLAFQIKDDILDVTGTTEELGKAAGSDLLQEKSTYITLLGLDESQKRLEALTTEAKALLAPFGEKATPLVDLADYILNRNH